MIVMEASTKVLNMILTEVMIDFLYMCFVKNNYFHDISIVIL